MIDDEETTNQEYDDEETDGSDIDNRRNNLNEHNQATTRNMARNASKSISKNIGVTIKNIGANVSKVIITLLKNPYVLLAVAIIIVSVAAYFILKDLFSNNSTKSTSKTISEIVGSKDADPQTKSLVNTYELNRSLLTASIKDVNLIYNNYIKELNESDPVNSLKDMTTMYGDDEVKIEEMKFESDPKEYEKPLEERKSYKNSTNSKVTSYSSSADVGDFVNVAKEIWQKVYSEKYSYSFQASPPYNNGLIDCSAYVSWVLSEAGYDVGRLNTEGLKNYDWSKFGFEVIEVSQNENVIDKLQPGDILVRSDGGGGYGHTNITVNVENGTVWAYDCGNSSNWLNSGGEPYNATGFASGSGGGSNTRAGVIIRVGNSTSTSSSSSSKNKVSNSSKVNSSATTDKYPKDSTYVLPSQKRELYKHMLMTEKYNFNMITWKLYKAEGKGASRTLPSEPSDDIEYTVEPALGLRVPKSDEKTVNYFVQLVEPYLQSSLFPISMYSMSVTSEGNITKEKIEKNAEFAYSIIKDAYSDITMNIYEIEHYTENWSHEEWDVGSGNLKGEVQCLRVPNNLYDICKSNTSASQSEVQNLYCSENDCTNWGDMVKSGFLTSDTYFNYQDRVKGSKCLEYSVDRLISSATGDKAQANTELKGKAASLGASSSATYEYRNCSVLNGYEADKENETITETGKKTEDALISTNTEVDVEYKPYRVKAFDIVLEYEYEFEVYNTSNSPDSISTSSTNLPDERIEQHINATGYESEASLKDCHDDGNLCDGKFQALVGTYSDKVNRIRVDTTKNWNDKLRAASDGFLHRKYNIDDVIEFLAEKEGKDVSDVKLSNEAKKYYNKLDSDEKLNRIDLINAVPEIYNSYIKFLQAADKNIAIKQDALKYSYDVLIKRFKEIEKNQVLPYIYGQTLGLNLKYMFDDDKEENCNNISNSTSDKGGYEWPVPNNKMISSLFGYTPIYGSNHEGIDIWANETGEDKSVDVVAAKDGTVYLAQDLNIPSNKTLGSGGYGNHIIIKHDDGKYTLYGHLETGTFKVKDKEYVKAGQVIAKMGSSGNSSAWHLHFNISGEPYSSCEDPLLYYNVEPTSSKYPEYSKLNKNDVTEFNAYKFVSVKSSSSNPSTLDGFLFIGDSRVDGIETNLKALGNNITAIGVTSSKQSQWIDVVKNLGGTILGEKITLPKDPSGISLALGVNEVQNTSKMDQLIDELVKKYPDKKIYVNSVYPVGTSYTYINASDMNSLIKKFNEHLKSKCNNNKNLIYIDITTGLTDSSGYLKSEYSSDGLHLKDGKGEEVLVNNIKNIITGSKSSSGNSSSGVSNQYSVASELKDIKGVGSATNTTAFQEFKEKYFSYIAKWADAYEIDPYVVLAIIAHESGCGRAADENYYQHRPSENNSDVYGIGQLTVWGTTTREFGSAYKDKNGNTIGTVNLKNNFLGNAELQIRVACAMLKVDFFGKQDNAISGIYAYNCGGNIKWTKEHALSTPNPVSHKIYVELVAAYYDIENSGGYSSGIYCSPDSDDDLFGENIVLSGSYVGAGKEEGNEQSNKGYFTNAGGIKYHTYNQSAYGTFWTNNGCGPTSCAIVLSGLTGKERNPTDIFNLYGYTSFEKDLIPLLNKYNIKTEQYYSGKSKTGNYYGNIINDTDKKFILNQLSKGYPIIIYIKPGGTYNGCHYNGHFMTLLGVKDNGDVYVGDPGGWGRDGWISLNKLVSEGLVTVYLVCKP